MGRKCLLDFLCNGLLPVWKAVPGLWTIDMCVCVSTMVEFGLVSEVLTWPHNGLRRPSSEEHSGVPGMLRHLFVFCSTVPYWPILGGHVQLSGQGGFYWAHSWAPCLFGDRSCEGSRRGVDCW